MTPVVAAPVAPAFQVFSEEPGSDFTGMVPAHFAHIGIRQSGGNIAVAFKFLNEITLRSENFIDVVTSGRLSCIKYDKGQINSICVHHGLVKQFSEKNVRELILSPGGDEYSSKGEFTVHSLTEESYSKMYRLCTSVL